MVSRWTSLLCQVSSNVRVHQAMQYRTVFISVLLLSANVVVSGETLNNGIVLPQRRSWRKLDNYNPGLLLLASLDGIHWSLRRQPCFLHHWQRSPPPMRLQSPLEFAPKAEV